MFCGLGAIAPTSLLSHCSKKTIALKPPKLTVILIILGLRVSLFQRSIASKSACSSRLILLISNDYGQYLRSSIQDYNVW